MSKMDLLVLAFAALWLLGIAGAMDYQDAVRERNAYCKEVTAGKHADYRGIYGSECKELQQ